MANSNDRRPSDRDVGFNTIRNSAYQRRQKAATRQKYTLFAIIALITLMIAALLVMAIGGIIANVSENGEGNKGDNGVTPPGKDKIEWSSTPMDVANTQQGPLVLVNSTHAYTFPATDEHLQEIYAAWAKHSPRIYMLSGLSKYMDTTALTALDSMLAAFSTASGKTDILLHYAYRTYEDQEALGSSIQPGYSDHHTGYGCVLKYSRDGRNYDLSADTAYAWITENAHKYGFVVRYPADKVDATGVSDYDSYFRYVGVAHATYMKEQNLCLEEYVALLKGYTPDKPLTIAAADGNTYEVYYTAVSGSTSVKVPTNYAYTVSGTNDGGVVITVNRSQSANAVDTAADTATDTPAA